MYGYESKVGWSVSRRKPKQKVVITLLSFIIKVVLSLKDIMKILHLNL